MFTIQAGARFFAVFHDVNAYLAIVPMVRAAIRSPAAAKRGAPVKTDALKKPEQPKKAEPGIKGGKK